VRVLIFHGYLLQGTGSNVYNAELGAALVRAGHELHLLCQDRDPFALDWVDASGVWEDGRLVVSERRASPRATVYRPDIGGVLPLYVADRYEGFDARPFPELSDDELDAYVQANVAAVREVAERARPDVALANHLVMGPAILSRALHDVPYAVKIHGSALEYTVKPHRARFRPFAAEGLARAGGVLVGSRHTAESLWAEMDDPSLPGRTRLGPPGVDIARFTPRDAAAPVSGASPAPDVRALRDRLAGLEPDALTGSSFDRYPREAVAALDTVEPGDRLVVYVGKLIASKGVELLLAAWPRVLAREPRARLLIVGFGAFREGLEALAGALAAGDLEAARAIRGEDGRVLPELDAYLAGADGSLRLDRVAFAGRLAHDEVAELFPAAEAMAMTSTFPEAFGMVAAEAAACGTLPVVANHSGMGEVARTLRAVVPAPARSWLSFEVGPTAVRELADALSGWLAAPDDVRAATREAIVAETRARYSWDGVARAVVAAARGELDELPEPR
jgi:glycosyltransferase involved in cell wall biosynthesis